MPCGPGWQVPPATALPRPTNWSAIWRKSGAWAIRDNEELELGVRCIAAGIYDDSGKLQAGLSISAPAERLRDEWIPVLLRTAAQISEALGYEAKH